MGSPTQWTWVWVSSASWWWTGKPAAVLGATESWTRLGEWTELTSTDIDSFTFLISIPIFFLIAMVRQSLKVTAVRVDILDLFLILAEMLFHQGECCLLVVYHRWLLCWGRFPPCPLSAVFVYQFCEKLFLHLLEMIIWFSLFSLLTWCPTDWTAYTEESLHPWDKSHLVMVYKPVNVLSNSVW